MLIKALVKVALILAGMWLMRWFLIAMKQPDLMVAAYPWVFLGVMCATFLRREIMEFGVALLYAGPQRLALRGKHYYFDGQEIRIVFDVEDNPHFCGDDVCAVLGIRDADAAFSHLAGPDYGCLEGNPLKCIAPAALLRFLERHPHRDSQRFQRWLEREVLRTLAKRKEMGLPVE